jgi:hypothetical protein
MIGERLLSANPPAVQVISPNGGEQLSGEVVVRWQASDADGDPLVFTIMYSSDGGATWSPIATDLRGESATLASTEGLAGSQRGLFRVTANDGMRTASDESDATFAVPDAPPEASIVSPMDGTTFPQGATVMLLGSAYDAEDGALAGDSLQWSSNLDGDLGSGIDVRTRDLQPGVHVITLSATDSAGGAAARPVSVTIGAPRPNQPDQAERDQAADFLLNGNLDGGRAPWLAIGLGAGAALLLALAAAVIAKMRVARRPG